MIVKVILGTMQNARKLVSIAESIPYDVELCYGRCKCEVYAWCLKYA